MRNKLSGVWIQHMYHLRICYKMDLGLQDIGQSRNRYSSWLQRRFYRVWKHLRSLSKKNELLCMIPIISFFNGVVHSMKVLSVLENSVANDINPFVIGNIGEERGAVITSKHWIGRMLQESLPFLKVREVVSRIYICYVSSINIAWNFTSL